MAPVGFARTLNAGSVESIWLDSCVETVPAAQRVQVRKGWDFIKIAGLIIIPGGKIVIPQIVKIQFPLVLVGLIGHISEQFVQTVDQGVDVFFLDNQRWNKA